MRGVKDGKPFLIMEEQSGKAGQRFFSAQPHPGQLRLWAFQAVAHGAMGVNYFRWDTADFGAEEYWHGILNHDRSKSPGFDEIKQVVKDMKSLGPGCAARTVLRRQRADFRLRLGLGAANSARATRPDVHVARHLLVRVDFQHAHRSRCHLARLGLVALQSRFRAGAVCALRKAGGAHSQLRRRRRHVRHQFPPGRERRKQPDRAQRRFRDCSAM